MVFNHLVKHNGIYYPAGANVPVGDAIVETVLPLEEPTMNNAIYTKTEILGLKVAEVREIAEREGFENTQELSGAKIKEMLIEHFGL